MKLLRSLSFALCLAIPVLAAPAALPRPSAQEQTQVRHAEWAKKAVIYELNTRQFTPEGTFKAILPRIPELQRLGVGIVWFMPIHPIGVQNRKGPLGSPYAVRDYYGVNPEFGNLDDFKAVVAALHAAGMHVIIDEVANHTAWDNPLAKEHPDWYVHDARGHFVEPYDWTDVIKLDYSKPALREYMWGMLEHWVRDVGVDGFRCDVASEVPTSFWNEARQRLDRIRPVFMLAEAEKPGFTERAFDADYESELFNIFDRIAHGKAKAFEVAREIERDRSRYPVGAWRMLFSSNHDQNTWLGSDQERLGQDGSKAFADLVFSLPGKPLIYNGQEVANARRLAFFSRDPIAWGSVMPPPPVDLGQPLEAAPSSDTDRREFYRRLVHVYADVEGEPYALVPNDRPDRVVSFRRGRVRVVANLAPSGTEVTVEHERLHLYPWEVRIKGS